MRIIAGELGGRHFSSPKTTRTHPMSDKARGALFNTLGDIRGLAVLDVCAGTGACSLEAISRGARTAVAIEHDTAAQRTIRDNIASLGLEDRIRLIKASAQSWLQANPEIQFDLVLCDPPYDNVQPQLATQLARHVVLGGILVLSWPDGNEPPELPLTFLRRKSYGDASLIFYRHAM